MYKMQSAQISALVVSITAAAGVVVFLISKRRDADQKIKSLRKKLESLGHDVVILHRSRNSNKCLGISPFDLKVS